MTAVMMTLSIYMVFAYAPMEKIMGWPQKIFYFHVPIAISCYVGFFITFVGSIGYLWTKDLRWDRIAVSGADLGVMLATLMLLTGMMWGRPIWGAYWTWDPRLTTSFILWLIFVGYLILRTRVEDEVTRAKYAAVMGIIGYADVPLVPCDTCERQAETHPRERPLRKLEPAGRIHKERERRKLRAGLPRALHVRS